MKPIAIATALSALLPVSAMCAEFPNEPGEKEAFLGKSHRELGRLAVIDILGDYVIAIPEAPSSPDGADHIVRALNISNPSEPVTEFTFGQTYHPVQAHGTYKVGRELYIGGTLDAIYLEDDGSLSLREWSAFQPVDFQKSAVSHPWASTGWWSYNPIEGNAVISINGVKQSEWDHLGTTGVIGMPSFVGDLLIYASDQSMTGVAIYDVSDPASPKLLDVLNQPSLHPSITDDEWIDGVAHPIPAPWGLGGYWYEIYGHYIVFARRGDNPGIQVVDFSDPANLKVSCEFFLADADTPVSITNLTTHDPMYVGFQDEFIFSESLKININTCELDAFFDEAAAGIETGQYSRPIGNLLLTGGGQNYLLPDPGGLGIWTHQSQSDTRPPFVSYHIPQDGRTNYSTGALMSVHIPETLRSETIIPGETLILEKIGGEQVEITYVLSHTGMLSITATNGLEENTTYRMTLRDIEDAVHNKMEPYSFVFSTGSSINENAPTIADVSLSPATTVIAGETVTASVTASDADGDTLSYRFRKASGEDYTAWSSSSSAELSYDSAGTYSINVQVSDGSNIVTSVANVLVVESLYSTEISLTSSPMALSQAGDFIWVANPDNDTVAKVSTTTQNKIAEFPVGDHPFNVAVDGNGQAWISLRDEDAIAVINAAGQRIETIELDYGSAPTGIVTNRTGDTLYVALSNAGKLVKIDAATYSVTAELAGLASPRAISLSESGTRLLAARYVSNQNWGEVYDISTADMALSKTIILAQHLENDEIDEGRGAPNHLSSVFIDGNDEYAYVIGKKDNTSRGLLYGNEALDDDNTVRTFVGKIDLSTGSEVRSERIDLDNADSPSAFAIASNGLYAFVALQGNNKVLVLPRDARTGTLSQSISNFATGLAPRGLLFDPATEQLFVKNFSERTVSSVDMSGVLLGNVANPTIRTTNTVRNEVLSDSVLKGKQIFYNGSFGLDEEGEFLGRVSAEGYLSCGTCHDSGANDGRVWDFTSRGEGLRNNISLVGRSGTRFGNVHWSGNFDEIQDFENDMRLHQLGRGLMTDEDFAAAEHPLGAVKAGASADLDDLAAFVSSLGKASLPRSPYRDNIGELTSEGLLGQQVFADLGCDTCHRGSAFTDGVIHDVGTLRSYSGDRLGEELTGIITPSLLGLFNSAPYLHDGTASTLEEVFTVVGGDVYQLEAAELTGQATVVTPEFSYFRAGAGVSMPLGSKLSMTVPTNAHSGVIRVRYGSVETPTRLLLTVNGTQYARELELLPSVDGEDVSFAQAIFSVELDAGNSTIDLRIQSETTGATIVVDDMTVSSSALAEAAEAHTAYQTASLTDKNNLIAYLQQLDQKSAPEDSDEIVLGIIEDEVEEVPEEDSVFDEGSIDDPADEIGDPVPDEETPAEDNTIPEEQTDDADTAVENTEEEQISDDTDITNDSSDEAKKKEGAGASDSILFIVLLALFMVGRGRAMNRKRR